MQATVRRPSQARVSTLNFQFPPERLAHLVSSTKPNMKQIHIWPNHIRIAHLDFVMIRSSPDQLERDLKGLTRLGLDTAASNLELHEKPGPA